ncbi:hypothetical protein D3C79_976430 [compost metagenome]
MAIGEVVAVLLHLNLITAFNGDITEDLDPKDIVLIEGVAVVHRNVDLVLQGFVELCCVKIELRVHSYSNLGKARSTSE